MRKIAEIEGVYSGLSINNEKISYYTNNFVLKILNANNHSFSTELQFDRDYNYRIIDGKFYLTIDDGLKVFDIEKEASSIKRTEKVKYIKVLTALRFMGISYHRKERTYDNYILDQNFNVLWKLSGEMSFRDVHETHLLLSDRRGTKIGYLNFEDCKVKWQQELSQRITGESIETKDLIIIPLSERLVAVKRDSGEKLWDVEFPFSHYNYDKTNGKLYGLGGSKFEVIDCATGNREIEKDLNLNANISSHLTYYCEERLYFTTLIDNNTPVFGAVNLQTGELVFIQEVEITGEKSFRKGLDKPIVVGNRLYVKDSMNTLHIFEKE